MKLQQLKSKHTNKRIYQDETGFKYPAISRLSTEFRNTYGLYVYAVNFGIEEAERIYKETGRYEVEPDSPGWKKYCYRIGKPIATVESNKASTLGTSVHKCLEDGFDSDNPEIQSYVEQYKKHIAPFLEIKHQEIVLAYRDHNMGFAGTCDLIGLWHNSLIIGDWKTSVKPKEPKYFDGYALQLSAYSCCYEQMYGIETRTGVIFNLMPDGVKIFEIQLAPAKEFLLNTLLPKYYEYYRLPEHKRPYPNQWIPKELGAFQKSLVNYVVES